METAKLRYAIVLLAALVSPATWAADDLDLLRAQVEGCSPANGCALSINGEITADHVPLVKQALEQSTRGVPSQFGGSLLLLLDSEGGDVYAALEIGRLVRGWRESSAFVSLDSKCLSACVFVLAGSLRRRIDGEVGIHRPFGTSTQATTYESTQETFRVLGESIRDFFQEVNIPISLFDEMMSTPPQDIRILTGEELARFGIGRNDPIFDELQDGEKAQALGISKEEYLRRKYRSEQICGALSVNEERIGLTVSMFEASNLLAACRDAILEAEPSQKIGELL